jgi:hypothetical protein
MIGKWIELEKPERKRTYIYAPPCDGSPEGKIEFTNVTAIYASESGIHYLECDQGKVIVQFGWVAIILDVEAWTYPKHN